MIFKMKSKRVLIVTVLLCIFSCSFVFAKAASWKQEVMQIDQQIKDLEELKRGYEAKALRLENQAERLQFKNSEYIIAKRYWELADENRQIAKRIQNDIDTLKEKKQELINAHEKR